MKKKRFLSKIVSLFVMLSIISVSLFASAAESDPDNGDSTEKISNVTILSIDGKSKELQFNSVTPSGPNSFYVVNDNEVYIADTYSHSIKHYLDGILSNCIYIPESIYIIDFYINDGRIYILDESCPNSSVINTIVSTDMQGKVIDTILVPNSTEFLGYINQEISHINAREISMEDGIIAVKFTSDVVIRYHDGEWVLKDNTSETVRGLGDRFQINNECLFYTVSQLSYIELLGYRNSEAYVFTVETLKSEDIYYKRIYRVSDMKNITIATMINSQSDYQPRKEYFINYDGDAYQMLFDNEQNVEIVKLRFEDKSSIKSKSDCDVRKPVESIKQIDTQIKLAAFSNIDRTQVKANALDYINHTWVYNCDQNSNRSILIGCSQQGPSCDHSSQYDQYVARPSYLTEGNPSCSPNSCLGHTVMGVPYCWTSPAEFYMPSTSYDTALKMYINDGSDAFDYQINCGLFAGNVIGSSTHRYIFQTVGLDCSGFVQVCFEYNDTAKIGTSTIIERTSDFLRIADKSNSNKLKYAKIGDILVSDGHTMIVAGIIWNSLYNQVDSVSVYESTTGNHDKTVLQTRYPNELNNYYVVRYAGINLCSHLWPNDWTIATQSTCSQEGRKVKQCSLCGDISEDTIPIIAHDYKPATCESPQECRVCNATTGTANGHTWPLSWTTTQSATCTATGTEEKRCTICSDLLDTQSVPKLAHTWPSSWTTTQSATCTATGTEEKRCTNCGTLLGTQSIPKVAHTWPSSWTITEYPTCTTTGTEEKRCTNCSTLLGTQSIPKVAHTWPSSWTTTQSATCTATGTEEKRCTNCSTLLGTQSIPKVAHTWPSSWTVTQYSNCWQHGKEVKLCTVCSFQLAEQTTALNPNNHSGGTYNEVTTSPTCTASGVRTTFCSGCDGVLSSSSIAALGHTWGSWIYQGTYYDPDLQCNVIVYRRTCSRCGAIEHDYI
jgi:hypothetical protein